MFPDKPIILKGKDLKEFEEYQKRTPTEQEIEYCKQAQEYYKNNLPKRQK